MKMILGNTYPVKEQLKQVGCRWNADRKCWMATTEEMAVKARSIVEQGQSNQRMYRTATVGDGEKFLRYGRI
jgi:hypothetical protein